MAATALKVWLCNLVLLLLGRGPATSWLERQHPILGNVSIAGYRLLRPQCNVNMTVQTLWRAAGT